jgi:hypothetical protein
MSCIPYSEIHIGWKSMFLRIYFASILIPSSLLGQQKSVGDGDGQKTAQYPNREKVNSRRESNFKWTPYFGPNLGLRVSEGSS